MIPIDTKQGVAEDIGDIWRGELDDVIEVRVRMDLCDDDELSLSWKEEGELTTLYLPLDRISTLLAARKEQL